MQKSLLRTAGSTRAHGTIARVTGVSADVPHPRIQQAFSFKVFPEQVFDTPEAAGGHSAFLSSVRDILGHRCTIGVQTETSRGRERTHEASKKVGHCAGHEDDEGGDGEGFRVSKSRQIGEQFVEWRFGMDRKREC